MIKKVKYIFLLVICFSFLASCSKDDDTSNNRPTKPAELNDSTLYRIPVIFHVLHNSSSPKVNVVTPAHLQRLLTYVNQMYKGNIYGSSRDIKIEFYPTEVNESGSRLEDAGVEYVRWNGSYPINVTNFMLGRVSNSNTYIWDPNRFINVMIYEFEAEGGDGQTLGISHLPYKQQNDSTIQGLERSPRTALTKENLQYPYCISLNSRAINSLSGRNTNSNKAEFNLNVFLTSKQDDAVVTLAHELGHYLGLYHVFAEDNTGTADNCIDSDYCTDTPSYNKTEYDDWLENFITSRLSRSTFMQLFNRTNCSGTTFQSNNIMDYAYSLSYQFTQQQHDRMRHVLYYSPLIPGPKRNQTTRTIVSHEPLDLPIKMARCTKKL